MCDSAVKMKLNPRAYSISPFMCEHRRRIPVFAGTVAMNNVLPVNLFIEQLVSEFFLVGKASLPWHEKFSELTQEVRPGLLFLTRTCSYKEQLLLTHFELKPSKACR